VPEEPTHDDVVTLTIGGEWDSSCFPTELGTQAMVATIHFDTDVSHPGTECFEVVSEWSISDSVGPLPTGTYTVTASAYDGATLVEEPDDVCTFEVLEPPPEILALAAWGVVAMTLLGLVAGTVVFMRRRGQGPGDTLATCLHNAEQR